MRATWEFIIADRPAELRYGVALVDRPRVLCVYYTPTEAPYYHSVAAGAGGACPQLSLSLSRAAVKNYPWHGQGYILMSG